MDAQHSRSSIGSLPAEASWEAKQPRSSFTNTSQHRASASTIASSNEVKALTKKLVGLVTEVDKAKADQSKRSAMLLGLIDYQGTRVSTPHLSIHTPSTPLRSPKRPEWQKFYKQAMKMTHMSLAGDPSARTLAIWKRQDEQATPRTPAAQPWTPKPVSGTASNMAKLRAAAKFVQLADKAKETVAASRAAEAASSAEALKQALSKLHAPPGEMFPCTSSYRQAAEEHRQAIKATNPGIYKPEVAAQEVAQAQAAAERCQLLLKLIQHMPTDRLVERQLMLALHDLHHQRLYFHPPPLPLPLPQRLDVDAHDVMQATVQGDGTYGGGWSLLQSVFRSRLEESDGRSLHDTAFVEDKQFMKDWARTVGKESFLRMIRECVEVQFSAKVDQTGARTEGAAAQASLSQGVLDGVKKILAKHKRRLHSVYNYYCQCGDGAAPLRLNVNGFRAMLADAQLVDYHDPGSPSSPAACDRIFVRCHLDEDEQEEEAGLGSAGGSQPDAPLAILATAERIALIRAEFLEALVWLAVAKYVKSIAQAEAQGLAAVYRESSYVKGGQRLSEELMASWISSLKGSGRWLPWQGLGKEPSTAPPVPAYEASLEVDRRSLLTEAPGARVLRALTRLLQGDLLPRMPPEALQHPDDMRRQQLYCHPTEAVLRANLQWLNPLFSLLAARSGSTTRVDLNCWVEFVEAVGLPRAAPGLTTLNIRLAFVSSMLTHVDELSGQAGTMGFVDFLEALVRLAMLLQPPERVYLHEIFRKVLLVPKAELEATLADRPYYTLLAAQLKPDQTARMMQCIKRQASDAVDHIKNQLSVAGRSKEEVAKLQAELEELQRTQLGNGLMTRPHEKLQVLFEYLLHWLHKEYRTNGDMAQLLEQIAASIEDL